MSSFNHDIMSAICFPYNKAPVDCTAAMTTGKISGYKRTGNMYLNFAEAADIAESNVPHAVNPNVPKNVIRTIPGMF